ncbi:unnamed protein product [Ranitomeya imitator]|uniref:Helix-turn-helix domain-containing protein n=1 Tax=Ranitomeya imitator TaxID=111125 RepID=A0ABN9MDK5_9NEOB|nr:unnamed protein product [Ranitomeya imitator]
MKRLLEDTFVTPDVITFLMGLLEIVLTKNFFMFEDQFYLQVQGTAMGSNTVYQTHCLLWRRYIDDVFCLWHGTSESLLQFFNEINAIWPELTFTLNVDKYEINFLNTKVLQDQEGKLTLDLYTKASDRNNLLLYQSCHPKAIKKLVPVSQFESIWRIVSNPEIRSQRLEEMKQKFVQRGYPQQLLQQAQSIVHTSPRPSTSKRIAFVHTYHPFVYKVPFLPCFRRPSNLKNKIVRAGIGSSLTSSRQTFLCTPRKGTFPCLQCAQCKCSQRF